MKKSRIINLQNVGSIIMLQLSKVEKLNKICE